MDTVESVQTPPIAYPLKCNRKNPKSKYHNYLCNSETNRWARINTPTGKKVTRKIEEHPRNCRSANSKSLSEDFICNPATGRWVRKDGKVGKMIMTHYSKYLSGKPQAPKKTKASLQALKKTGPVKTFIPKLPPGYTFVKQLASSLSGQIYLAIQQSTGETVVIKKYKDNIDKKTADKMSQRVQNLSQTQSEYLLRYLNSYYEAVSYTHLTLPTNREV